MGNAKVYQCSCCGEVLTKPRFFKGLVYGSTCFLKVSGSKPKAKDTPKGIFLKADMVQLDIANNKIVAYIGNTRFSSNHSERIELLHSKSIMGGLVKVSEFDNGTNSVFNHVIVEQKFNDQLVLIPMKVVNRRTGEIICDLQAS
jgi:hypothetical protein